MKIIAHSLWVAGILTLLVAAMLAVEASLPHPELPADLVEGQREQYRTAKLIAGVGTLFFISGVVWVIFNRARARGVGASAAAT
jgi:hypothetical protein